MPDYTITSADVQLISGRMGTAFVDAIHLAGRTIYLDATDNNIAKLADASALATSAVAGITMNEAQPGQPINYALPGAVIDLGLGVPTSGDVPVLSAAAPGGIADDASDLVATNAVTPLGVVNDNQQLVFKPNVSGTIKV